MYLYLNHQVLRRNLIQDSNSKSLAALDRDNVATWANEYCLFGSDNAIVFYDDPEALISTSHSNAVYYREYWKSLMRAIDYILELRLMSKFLEFQTSDELQKLARIIRDIHPGGNPDGELTIDTKTRSQIRDFIRRISSFAGLVARIRNTAMPTNIGLSDYAVTKHRKLIEVLDIDKMLEHANRNIETIYKFVAYLDNMILSVERKGVMSNIEHMQIESRDVMSKIAVLQADVKKTGDWIYRFTVVLVALTLVLIFLTWILAKKELGW